MSKKALLMILDGWGIGNHSHADVIYNTPTPYWDYLLKTYPHSQLQASGENVGLPDGQMGNSEVGHLNIGAGRIVYQDLVKINKACADNSILQNKEIVSAFSYARDNGKNIHFMGLTSNGGVHSSLDHLFKLCDIAKEYGLENTFIHCFMDGRDVPPTSGAEYIDELQQELDKIGVGKIATVSGRYYAMDRDNRWERVVKAYDAMVNGEGVKAPDPVAMMRENYKNGVTDEFTVPAVVTENATIRSGDSVIFFNFRPDRAREMTRAMTQADFDGFERSKVPALADFVTMTEYDDSFDVHVAFPKTVPANVLADVLASNGLKQLHTAETEKYAHVTFFLNGGVEEPKEGETRVLIPSPKVATYDLKPEMSEPEVTEKLVEAINSDAADFYVVNYANCDMVGHTGVVEAAVKACEAVDDGLSRVIPAILAKGGFALITADHGNADHMYDVVDGKEKPFTAHTTNRVPLIVVDDKPVELSGIEDGRLSDIAPTILAMMGVDRPAEMTGRVLATEA